MKQWYAIGMAAALAVAARAQTLEETGRRVLAEYGSSVLSISAVVKIEAPGMGREPQEGTVNLYGTVVAPNGLIAISATTLAPLSGLTEQLEARGIRPTTSVSQIKVRLPDGAQVPARQVLSDEESDLAFLMPEPESGKPAPTWPKPVIFEAGVTAQPLDPVISLTNSNAMFHWIPIVGTGQVNAILDNPRRQYLVTRSFTNAAGVPVFLGNGRPLGLATVRRETRGGAGGNMQVQQAVLVLPADTVAELVEQAQAAAAKRNTAATDNKDE